MEEISQILEAHRFPDDVNSTHQNRVVTQMTLSDGEPVSQESIAFMILGVPIVCVNGFLIFALAWFYRTLNWKRFACTLNLAVNDLFCGFVLVLHSFADMFWPGSTFEGILGLELCTNILLTIFNYDLALCVQYLAVKKPLYYQTKLTLNKILLVVGSLWATVLLYASVKAVLIYQVDCDGTVLSILFRAVDTTAMGVSLVFNSIFYFYVLKVATTKRCESLKRRRLSEKQLSTSTSSSGSESDLTPIMQQSTIVQYNSIITLGVHLVIYVATVSPLFVYWVFSLIYGLQNIVDYDLKVLDVGFKSFWFARAVLDPVTLLIRERNLLSVRKLLRLRR